MGGYFVADRSPLRGRWGCRSRWAVVLVAVCALHAAPLMSAERTSSSVERPESVSVSQPARSPLSRPIAVADVVLHAGGVLQGVVYSREEASGAPVACVRLVLLRDGKMVAESRSDRSGRFFFSGLRGGTYAVAVVGKRGMELNLCRVWTTEAAPPKASEVAKITLGDGIVRGQGPLPSVKFSEAALMAGVVVGAIAAPIIYHNAQKSNRVPASP